MSHQWLIYACMTLLAFVTVCEAELYCYICNTASGLHKDKCGDDFRLTSVDAVSCRDGTCQKTRGYRKEGSKNVIEVTRGCIPYTKSTSCREGTHFGISATICNCNEAYCNSADTLIPSKYLSISVGLCMTIFMSYIL